MMTGRTCDERLQWIPDGLPFANRSINKVQEVSFRVTGVQVGRFTGVNYRPATHRHKHVKQALFGKRNGVFKAAAQRRFSKLTQKHPEKLTPELLTQRS